MVPDSNGVRSASITAGANSGASSRKSTPLCAQEIAPGFATRAPPPTMLAERVPGLLPDLDVHDALEVSAVHSLAGFNLADRLIYGAVVDFVLLHAGSWQWPAFNLADSAITVGVIALLWDSLFGASESRK